MLRDRLRSMELRITELADYLQISRPTMYKYIDYYDNKEFDLINKKILKLFNFINENELVGKKGIVNYILNNLVEVKELNDNMEMDVIKVIKKFIISNPESKKSQFIVACATTDYFDDILAYLVDIIPLINKSELSDIERNSIEVYNEFKKAINSKGELQ